MFDYKKIDSYEAACADQGRDPEAAPNVSKLPEGEARYILAAHKLAVIAVSLNRDEDGNPTKANWNDTSEYKWFPWMRVHADKDTPSGSALSLYVTAYVLSFAVVPARLTCREEEVAEYFFEQFKPLWEDYILHRE